MHRLIKVAEMSTGNHVFSIIVFLINFTGLIIGTLWDVNMSCKGKNVCLYSSWSTDKDDDKAN